MTLSAAERLKVAAYVNRLPDRHIPPEDHAKIRAVADSIAYPIWGRGASPEQIAYLHQNDLTEPSQIHAAFSAQPHPHAPNLSVGDYPQYVAAFQTYRQHSK